MMKGWLIYNKNVATENKSYIEWFIQEATKQNIHLQLIYREDLSIGIINGNEVVLLHGETVSLPDFTVVRVIEPILQAHLESLGITTFNCASTALICNHKSWTYVELNKLNIPIVPTFFATKDTVLAKPPLPFPLVIKEATGRSGKQVHYVQNKTEWQQCLSRLTSHEYVVQATNVRLGEDVRVFVIGKEIVAAVLRKNRKDFRANFKLGGKAIPFELSENDKKMIYKIINHFDFGLVGIDFLIGNDGELLFNEIEDVVGSRILSEVSDVNLLERYVTFIKDTLLQQETKTISYDSSIIM